LPIDSKHGSPDVKFLPDGVTEAAFAAAIGANVTAALAEDVGDGDVSAALIDPLTMARARVITREAGIVCGMPWVREVCRQVDPRIELDPAVSDGDAVVADELLCTATGPAASLLTAERPALNFLQLLSGTATATCRYVGLIRHTAATLLDTRKTVPGLRLAQKYAVRCGGAQNHRLGLFDQYLIKENHIAAAGSIGAAVAGARQQRADLKVEVEVENLDQLSEAIDAGADIAMIDNFSVDETHRAVQLAKGRIALESSGGIDSVTIVEVAEAGVDYISVGDLTKRVIPLDLSMRMETL
jgi:nicotinate-nucleotide pyrophosphorylase (carboxylating)